MVTCYGTWEVRYCVAQVDVYAGEPEVRFYAYHNNKYGLYLTDDISDPNVLWYDTEAEAKEHVLNANECVISKGRDIRKG